ncbi:glutamate carboxypeptidase [Longibacter salinarum]|uniref:Glutamate carboxypeptidase n=1 Tax=Longibacter salinarum TaxID=1850348 RepID=A0A2A8CXD3_9BACT|nr:M28 family peptidase [Longibacter salinarum]PEN13399.1 glutamate carboxypeptidase [Longibacter salinarum]
MFPRFIAVVVALAVILTFSAQPQRVAAQPLTGFSPSSSDAQQTCESRLTDIPTASAFRAHLQRLTKEPHPAGSAANERVAAYIDSVMNAAGLDVERYPYDLYMPSPDAAHNIDVELVTPIRQPLNRQEYILEEDRFSNHPNLDPAWNAYSGSGDVTAEVVYANYGRKEDFEWLAENDISVKGKIVLARYGGNFRGFKAKYAEEAGAAGLIMYTDPADGGYADGLPYPEGRHASESTIQRGSVLTPLSGDPLTPAGPSLPNGEGAERLSPEEADLPTIPVTPLPHASTKKILERMDGQPVPQGWQGALPFAYRVTGGSELTVRLRVDQPKQMVRASNVIGRIEGSEYPEQWIVLGAHYDAWTFGAVDPNSGTASLLLIAEALGEMAKNGCRLRRSILIGHWDAEEYGILGSTEWVEQLQDELTTGGVAYINADAAVSGDRFGGAAAPSLKQPLLDAAATVDHPSSDSLTVLERAQTRADDDSILGNLGGGSDHVGFYTFAGVPSLGAGMRGSAPIYHSAYDNFAWYERFADTTFVHGPALARVDGILALRLANAEVLPYDVVRYATDLRSHLDDLAERASEQDVEADFTALDSAIDSLRDAATTFTEARDAALANDRTVPNLEQVNEAMIGLEKAFLHPPGLQNHPLKRSLYASPDPFSGYASWMLPGLRYEVEAGTASGLARWVDIYVRAVNDLTGRVQKAIDLLQ